MPMNNARDKIHDVLNDFTGEARSNDWGNCQKIEDEIVAEIEWLQERNRELLAACKESLSMTGHDHWDRTQNYGVGCEKCIQQRAICARTRLAITKAEERTP